MFKYYNPNPFQQRTGDCVIRALSKILMLSWEHVYLDLVIMGFLMGAMPSENEVWGAYLKQHGYRRYIIPDTCPACYTITDFTYDHPYGDYIVGTGTHVVAVIDGNYYDSWDSGLEVPLFYWRK